MSRISPWIAVAVALVVVAVAWQLGTRDMDFLEAPTATQIELAKTRASEQLARPSDLFAVPTDLTPAKHTPETRRMSSGQAAGPPRIEFDELGEEPLIDEWSELYGLPAASFIDLASRLEADTRISWAHVAWERVIDRCNSDEDELLAAIKGVLRARGASVPEPTPGKPSLTLRVKAPADRVEITRRAAEAAAQSLTHASSGQISFTGEVESSRELGTDLEVSIGAGGPISAIRVAAPEAHADYAETLLAACFRLIASQLATNEKLQPITFPRPGETAAESLATRITRLAWRSFAAAHKTP